VNRLTQLLAAVGVAAIALAACGGGGSSTPQTSGAANTGAAPFSQPIRNGTPAPVAASRTSVGTVHLALTLPHVFTGKNAQAVRAIRGLRPTTAAKRAGAGVSRRNPAFVDPVGCGTNQSCPPNVLDIFVDGTLIPSLDNCVQSPDSMCVNATGNGTQTNIALPLYSTQYNDIVVVEWDYNHDFELAVGETFVGGSAAPSPAPSGLGLSPGGSVNATVTMLMNTAYVGILDIFGEADPEVMSSQTYAGLAGGCNSGLAYQSQFGLFSADGLGNFVAAAGYGGTSTPTLGPVSPDQGSSTTVGQTGVAGLYQVAWDSNCDGVGINATTANPAYAIYQDVTGVGFTYNYAGPFNGPSNQFGGATFGYDNCYLHLGPCPGGPYQALWNQWWSGAPEYYGDPIDNINAAVISGSVDIEDAPSPTPTP